MFKVGDIVRIAPLVEGGYYLLVHESIRYDTYEVIDIRYSDGEQSIGIRSGLVKKLSQWDSRKVGISYYSSKHFELDKQTIRNNKIEEICSQ